MDAARVARREQGPEQRPPDDEPLPEVRRAVRRANAFLARNPSILWGLFDLWLIWSAYRAGFTWAAIVLALSAVPLEIYRTRRARRSPKAARTGSTRSTEPTTALR